MVITYKGVSVKKTLCRCIKGEYYIKGEDCFQLDDKKWYRINSDKITFDHYLKKYVKKTNDIIYGIVGENDLGFIFGDFSQNYLLNITILTSLGTGSFHTALSESVFISPIFKSDSNEFYYYKKDYNDKNKIRKLDNYTFPLNYHASYRLQDSIDNFNNYHNENFKEKMEQKLSNNYIEKYLSDKTFGIEYETRNGRIFEKDCIKFGLIPVKDGSLKHSGINPYEYASIILSGTYKLTMIKKHCELLKHSCTKSINESLHVHVGNIPQTQEYVVSLYFILMRIQSELYKLFPPNVAHTSIYKSGGKDYCKPLTSLPFNPSGSVEENFNLIVEEMVGNKKRAERMPPPSPTMLAYDDDVDILYDENGERIDPNPIIPSIPSAPIDWGDLTIRSERSGFVASSDFITANSIVWETIRTPIVPKEKEKEKSKPPFIFGQPNPNDQSGDQKWNILSRYKIVNFNPLLFGPTGTIEFRCHTNTFNENKIIYWIFIINAICTFANRNKDNIAKKFSIKPSLIDIIYSVYSEEVVLRDSITDFIQKKQRYISNNANQFSDYNGLLDVFEDDLPNFNFINFYE